MIFGIGIDLVDIKEFERLSQIIGNNFLDLAFTEKERSQATASKKNNSLAGIFAAKEAIFKSLNLSPAEIKDFYYFQEIEITHLASGKPQVKFLGSLSKKFPKKRFKIFLSISYSQEIATSIAIIEIN